MCYCNKLMIGYNIPTIYTSLLCSNIGSTNRTHLFVSLQSSRIKVTYLMGYTLFHWNFPNSSRLISLVITILTTNAVTLVQELLWHNQSRHCFCCERPILISLSFSINHGIKYYPSCVTSNFIDSLVSLE